MTRDRSSSVKSPSRHPNKYKTESRPPLRIQTSYPNSRSLPFKMSPSRPFSITNSTTMTFNPIWRSQDHRHNSNNGERIKTTRNNLTACNSTKTKIIMPLLTYKSNLPQWPSANPHLNVQRRIVFTVLPPCPKRSKRNWNPNQPPRRTSRNLIGGPARNEMPRAPKQDSKFVSLMSLKRFASHHYV